MSEPARVVLVALDASSENLAAVETAALLAARSGATLLGLYVEDERLALVARLPVSIQFSLATGAPCGPEDLGDHVQAVAAQSRRALESAALRRGVRCTFRTARGQVATEIARAAGEAALVVLGRGARPARPCVGGTSGRAARGAATPTLIWPPGAQPEGVAAVCEPTAPLSLLDEASRLARALGSELSLLVVAHDTSEAERVEARARQALAGFHLDPRVRALIGLDLPRVRLMLAHEARTALVVWGHGPVLAGQPGLLETAHGPVLVVP